MADEKQTKALLRHAAAKALHYSGLIKFLGGEIPWRILMYHRVINPQEVPYPLQPGMFVRPETFELQMRYLANEARVISLDQLLTDLDAGNPIDKNTIVITFDDGWEDNYRFAFPILREYNLPATIFIATSFIGTTRAYWTDEIAQALSQLCAETKFLSTIRTRLEEREVINETAGDKISRLLSLPEGEEKIAAFDDLIEFLKKLPQEERRQAVQTVLTLAKEFCSTPLIRSFMNWEEVKEMSEAGISFGSHSHRHQPLPELTEARISDELDNSLQQFRERAIPFSPAFCYPRGAYNDLTQQVLGKKGIRYVLTTERESNLTARPVLLGRVGIHDDISNTVPLFRSRVWIAQRF